MATIGENILRVNPKLNETLPADVRQALTVGDSTTVTAADIDALIDRTANARWFSRSANVRNSLESEAASVEGLEKAVVDTGTPSRRTFIGRGAAQAGIYAAAGAGAIGLGLLLSGVGGYVLAMLGVFGIVYGLYTLVASLVRNRDEMHKEDLQSARESLVSLQNEVALELIEAAKVSPAPALPAPRSNAGVKTSG